MLYVHNSHTDGVFGQLPVTFESPDDPEAFWEVGEHELARDWHPATQEDRDQIERYWEEIEASGLERPLPEPASLDPHDPEPRKGLNPDDTGVNPEWRAWRDRERKRVHDFAPTLLTAFGNQPSTYLPERDGKLIPTGGAWVLVFEEPSTELQARFRLPAMSLWRARPHVLEVGTVTVGGPITESHRPHQGIIVTPGGNLHLWPHEYVIIEDPLALIGLPGAQLHSLGGQPVLDEDHLFYLMSRGMTREEATLMLFSTVTAQDYVYATFLEGSLDHLAFGHKPLALALGN